MTRFREGASAVWCSMTEEDLIKLVKTETGVPWVGGMTYSLYAGWLSLGVEIRKVAADLRFAAEKDDSPGYLLGIADNLEDFLDKALILTQSPEEAKEMYDSVNGELGEPPLGPGSLFGLSRRGGAPASSNL